MDNLKNKMPNLDQFAYAVHIEGGKCQLVNKFNPAAEFECLTPNMRISHCRLYGNGTMGTRYCSQLKKADYYLCLLPIDEDGERFVAFLNKLKRDVFSKWPSPGLSNPQGRAAAVSAQSNVSPILNKYGELRIKRKVCKFGTGLAAPLPIFLPTAPLDGQAFKKMNFKEEPDGDRSVKKNDIVRAFISLYPYSLPRAVGRGPSGISIRLKGILKTNFSENTVELRGDDWTAWAVPISRSSQRSRVKRGPALRAKPAASQPLNFSMWT
tara:strand:- start:884 stop:1684 length:801 start_codon:yes stop_codon:yes gene_type:complete